MLSDQLKNADDYRRLHPAIAAALDALRAYDPAAFTRGRKELDGDAMYLMQLEYETKPREDVLLEAHRQYIDVMYMLGGEECIYHKPTDALQAVTQSYDPAGDALLASLDGDVSVLRLQQGQFAVFLPQDAHGPGCMVDAPKTVRRLVVKVRIEPQTA